jgi:hypothetical protein
MVRKGESEMKERPAGITLIVAIYFILGGLSLVWSGLVFGWGGLSSLFGSLFGTEQVLAYGKTVAWSGFLGLISAVVQIVVAFGLLGMKKWAWNLALIAIALTVLEGIVGMINGGVFAIMCGSIGLILPGIMLVYLLRPNTRRAFNP